jgi:hypothetical protein
MPRLGLRTWTRLCMRTSTLQHQTNAFLPFGTCGTAIAPQVSISKVGQRHSNGRQQFAGASHGSLGQNVLSVLPAVPL